VLCLTLPSGTPLSAYLDHHVEHQLHEASLVAALIACAAMMFGEAISAKYGSGHGCQDHHDHDGPSKAHSGEPDGKQGGTVQFTTNKVKAE